MLLTRIRWKPLILGGIAILYADGGRRRRGLAARASELFVGKYGRRRAASRPSDASAKTPGPGTAKSEELL